MFTPDHERYQGVRPFNIYLLRLVYFLVFVAIGYSSWSKILAHQGAWDYLHGLAYCALGTYSAMCILGVVHPLKMLPLMLFMIIYKLLWLWIVAYPLWSTGSLAGNPAESMAKAFLWVILFIVAVPWKYALNTFVLSRQQFGENPNNSLKSDVAKPRALG
jgi:hypothetical protein